MTPELGRPVQALALTSQCQICLVCSCQGLERVVGGRFWLGQDEGGQTSVLAGPGKT